MPMPIYEGMLPVKPIEGHRGYYPVANSEQWKALPDLYKVMTWTSVVDPKDKQQRLSPVKSVTFDVVYMQPYGINARVSIHPSHVLPVLFTSHKNADCHLYSICEVELASGTKLPAKWLQDSTTGAFAVLVGTNHTQYAAMQGGFSGHVPEFMNRLDDGSWKYDYSSAMTAASSGKMKVTQHYALSNPFDSVRNTMTRTSYNKAKECLTEIGVEGTEADAVMQKLAHIMLRENVERFAESTPTEKGIMKELAPNAKDAVSDKAEATPVFSDRAER